MSGNRIAMPYSFCRELLTNSLLFGFFYDPLGIFR
jgi:hypothetical protein